MIDDYGTLLGVISSIEKNASGTSTPIMIQFDYVWAFIESLKQRSPVLQFNLPGDLMPEKALGVSVNLNTI